MENSRVIKYILLLVLGGAVFGTPFFVIAYDNTTTHPALTQEMVRLFNASYPNQALSESEKSLVMQGSVDEDEGTRPLRHFYDPVQRRGLAMAGEEFLSAKQWSENTLAQAGLFDSAFAGTLTSYFSGTDDYSWERAIYEYAWADKNRGLESLGHILHLLEDMTVPDHTRNDPHPPYADFLFGQASPYEHWTSRFSADSIEPQKILKNGDTSVLAGSLDNYFDLVATYSNNNFFSKDTINNNVFQLPNLNATKIVVLKLSDGKFYTFVVSTGIYLARYDEIINLQTGELEKNYSLNDKDDLILSDYWSHLSRQAILNGAGVIKLFFDEVSREKQTKILYNKNRSWFEKQLDGIKNRLFGVAGILYGSSVTVGDLSGDAPQNAPVAVSAPQEQSSPALPQPVFLLSSDATGVQTTSANAGPVVGANPAQHSAIDVRAVPPQTQPITSSQQFFAPQDQAGPTLGGDAAASSAASVESFAAATTTEAAHSQEATSTPSDTTPPDIRLFVSECENSISSSGCVIATTTIHLSWFSTASDVDYYSVACFQGSTPCADFVYNPTHATSTEFFMQNNAIYTFSAKAKDISGNESAPIIKTVEIRLVPVVINEIAWMGTGGNATTSKDEWLELYSNSSQAIDLSSWSLAFVKRGTTTPSTAISLAGSIASRSYYLIERTDNSVISNIAADLITPFGTGLVDSGMAVQLLRRGVVMDQTPDAASGWIAGSLNERRTMERIDPLADGLNRDNWGTYQQNEISENAKNVEGDAIHGTPAGRNSLNFLISQNNVVSHDTTLHKENSPYIISSAGLNVNEGVTLSIEPGVVIKLAAYQAPFFKMNGTLKLKGATQDPIVITSIYDDTYGGDTNQDGMCNPADASSTARCPVAGDWSALLFNPQSRDSELRHAIIRYGGRWFPSMAYANIAGMVIADHSSPVFESDRFEYSQTNGLFLHVSSANIAASKFLHNERTDTNRGAGVFVNGGSPTITQSEFDHNSTGVWTQGQDGGEVTQNVFTNQAGSAITMVGGMARYGGNRAERNGLDAIDVVSAGFSTDAVMEADLPYVVGRDAAFQVAGGARLVLKPGVIVKFRSNSSGITVNGSLDAQGSEASPVVFTHFADDDYGGDTNKDATTTSASSGNWGAISVNGTATSTIHHAVVRYGGGYRYGIHVNNSVLEIKNSVVENNKNGGVVFTQSSGSVSDTAIRNQIEPHGTGVMGLYLAQNSNVALHNVVFRNNERGIVVDGTSALINNGGIDIDGSNQTKTYPADLLP